MLPVIFREHEEDWWSTRPCCINDLLEGLYSGKSWRTAEQDEDGCSFYDLEMPETQFNSTRALRVPKKSHDIVWEKLHYAHKYMKLEGILCSGSMRFRKRFREGYVRGESGSGMCHMKDLVLYLEGCHGPSWKSQPVGTLGKWRWERRWRWMEPAWWQAM